MKILVLDDCYDHYDVGIFSNEEFERLGLLLTNIDSATFFLLNKWLENVVEGVFEDNCFYTIYKKENLLTIMPYFTHERNEAQFCIISIPQLQKLIKEVLHYKKMQVPTIVIMRANDNYFIKTFNVSIVNFMKISSKGENTYKTYDFYRPNHLEGIGRLLIHDSKNLCFEWLKSTSPIGSFFSEPFTIYKKKEVLTILYNNDCSFITSMTIEEKWLIKVNEYYERLIKQDIEDFLLIKTDEGFSFMTNPFEEIKVEIDT